jgi:hypothetical protein
MTTFNAGVYSLGGFLGKFADHAFVGTDDPVWFNCFGGHDDKKGRHYPYVSGTGNLLYARSIADLHPWDPKSEYSGKPSCGIIYGLNGFCHQAANRILYATDSHIIFMKPRGYVLSFILYGNYGNGLLLGTVPLLKLILDEITNALKLPPITNLNWIIYLSLAE